MSTSLAKPRTERNPALVYLARLQSKMGRKSQKVALNTLAKMLTDGAMTAAEIPWQLLRYEHTQELRSRLAERYAPATANRHLCALRGVLEEAWGLGLMPAELYQQARKLKPVKGSRPMAGREVTPEELEALFADARKGPGAARDAALLACLYGGGLRRTEATLLKVSDFDTEDGSLRVRGKGGKPRTVFITGGARRALEAWLRARGGAPGPLFCPVYRSGRVKIQPITDAAVLLAIRRMQLRAGVKAFTPHDLRRSFASHLLDSGADIAQVQRLMGHEDPKTTSRYDRRALASLRKVSGLLHIPYRENQ